MKFKHTFAALAFAMCASSAANAANLVQNGGFETGNEAGFIAASGTFTTTAPAFVHSGTYGLAFGAVGADGFLTQTLDTVAGQSYTISFYANSETGIPNDLSVYFGGKLVADNFNFDTGSTFELFSYTAIATSASTDLTFGLRNDPYYSALDDISVVASGVSTVPLPASAPMFGAALMALGAVGYGLKRKGKAAA